MRRRHHEQIVQEKDRTIRRLERQNEELLNRLMFATGQQWMPPPMVDGPPDEPLPDYAFSPDPPLDVFAGDE